MKVLKMNRNNNILCPRTAKFSNADDCKNCVNCFGVVAYSHVNCKGGFKKDGYIKRQR